MDGPANDVVADTLVGRAALHAGDGTEAVADAFAEAAGEGEGEITFNHGVESQHPDPLEGDGVGHQIHHLGRDGIFDKKNQSFVQRKNIGGENGVQHCDAGGQRSSLLIFLVVIAVERKPRSQPITLQLPVRDRRRKDIRDDIGDDKIPVGTTYLQGVSGSGHKETFQGLRTIPYTDRNGMTVYQFILNGRISRNILGVRRVIVIERIVAGDRHHSPSEKGDFPRFQPAVKNNLSDRNGIHRLTLEGRFLPSRRVRVQGGWRCGRCLCGGLRVQRRRRPGKR